jgi:two-component system KDP operon response regulator KdpE
MTETVLLIEDDVVLSETLRLTLTKKGFSVEVAGDAISGLQKAYATKPDVILLDINLPGMDGWQACTRFREMSDVPIIMLTALDSDENVVKGLDMGADDYIIKPVTVAELTARIRALLRRVARTGTGKSSRSGGQILRFDYLIIDFDKHEITVDGNRVDLSPTEFRLLSVMARHKGRMLPHEFLLNEVWGPEYRGDIDYLRLYVSYLRRKIEKKVSKPSLIHNEWGVGYRFG